MRFVYFNDFRLGILKRDNVVDITEQLSDMPVRDNRDLINGLIENYDKYNEIPRMKIKIDKFKNYLMNK